jgi:hypothetical protein
MSIVQTTLDPQVRSELVAALIQLPTTLEFNGRTTLLGGLDPSVLAGIERSNTPRLDLENLVDAAARYVDPAGGRWGLAVLLGNAIDAAANSQVVETLTAIRDRLIPVPGQLDFSKVSTTPPLPEAQYVASACQQAPALLPTVTPNADDRDYLESVRDRYRAWRDAAEYKFISSAIIPPAEFIPGEVTYRRVRDTGGPTAQLWSLCRTNDELFDHRRLLVLGRPGIGKTSLLQFLARQYTDAGGALLPVIVSLRTWTDAPGSPRTLLQFIKDFLVNPADRKTYPRGEALAANLDGYLADRDHQRRLIFLLDDYNRMAHDDAADYARRLAAIRDFADQYYRAVVVVVSRSLDYDGGLDGCDPEFEVVEVNPWGRAQIAEYLRRNAPELLPFANDPRLLDLADIPNQLAQLVDIIRATRQPPETLFGSVQSLLHAFVDRLFSFSEQAGRGDPTLRPQIEAALTKVAAGLARDNKKGAYVDYPQVVGYLGAVAADPPPDRVLQIAADATILDVVPGVRHVGFEGQELEDYFAGLAAGATAPAALADALATGQQDALQVARTLDQAGMLASHAATA